MNNQVPEKFEMKWRKEIREIINEKKECAIELVTFTQILTSKRCICESLHISIEQTSKY